MPKKVLLVAFQGQPMCFIHVLLNGLELQAQGHLCKIIIEGEATRLIPEISQEGHFLNVLYRQMLEKGLLEGVCRACSLKMQVLENIKTEGLSLLDDMSGHPGMAKYIEQGFEIINF
ncbi:MAG: cytoplasmic protein [Proteobacteria bacterium]|nr:cytoplasmic protein [Pseudomonadota bacterium]MBU1648522.1 cytoplasmic protein [Pseudomonadota bacterium]